MRVQVADNSSAGKIHGMAVREASMNTTLVGINSEITSEDERRRKHIARKTSKSITNSVRLAVVLFLLTVPVLAQLSSTGTISGTVKDSSGAIDPAAYPIERASVPLGAASTYAPKY